MIDLRQKKLIIVFSGIAIIAFLLCFILYIPLVNQLRAKSKETRALEAKLLEARNIITFMKTMGSELALVTEDNFSVATDTLMKQGGLYHIDFISTKPGAPIREEVYVMLPIDIALESGYSELGDFLGSLDNLKNSVVKVNEFEVAPSMSEPSKLKTRLTLNIYVLR
jgi:Tfp pilus assembly protein PilO